MIYYACFYSTKDSSRVKNYAGEDKVDYICKALNEIGEDVLIISNAKTTRRKYAKREMIKLSEHTNLLYFASLPRLNLVSKILDTLWGYLQLVCFVFMQIKSTDTVLVYHSLGYRGVWGILRRIKKFNYILEVEELYQKFNNTTSSYKNKENNIFQYADSFLFSNNILQLDINRTQKPYAIINGIYSKNRTLISSKEHKKKIIVYAGSFEPQKGVDYVIYASKYLPVDYETKIIGWGNEEDIVRINKKIKELSSAGISISYDGVFKGDEYIKYLQRCTVGVCIQNEDDDFNQYEYPSKIFSYLSNNLQVVVNNLIQVKESAVYPYLHVAKSNKGEDIAAAIISCEHERFDCNEVLTYLDIKFKKDIIKLIRR